MGSDPWIIFRWPEGTGFNPRSRVGSDLEFDLSKPQLRYVSIHAPAWGATWWTKVRPSRHRSFNPRSRVGSDISLAKSAGGAIEFQSTLPRGERLSTILSGERSSLFQSTLPRGERLKICCGVNCPSLFQSTLPRGERRSPSPLLTRRCSFNPRSRVGSDFVLRFAEQLESRFNPRSRVGSDQIGYIFGMEIVMFQSTLPRGERPGLPDITEKQNEFQSTLPRGERPHNYYSQFF